MTIQKVSLKEIDDKSPYGYPKRTIEIKTKEGTIQTPTRSITNHEYRQKEIIPAGIQFQGNSSFFLERMSRKKLELFLTSDSPFENLFKRIRIQNERSQHVPLNLAMIKPSITRTKNEEGKILKNSSMDLLVSSERHREKFLRMIIKLQQASNMNTITIPSLNLQLSEMKKVMKEITEFITKDGSTPVFFFELGKNFPELLKYATHDLQIQLIGINYKKYTSAIQSYEAMRDVYDKDVAFFVANTSRADPSFDEISTMHYLPFLSNDIFSSFIPTPKITTDIKSEQESVVQNKLDQVKLFDKTELKIRKITKGFDKNQILKQMDKFEDVRLTEMLDNFQDAGKPNQTTKLNELKAFSKIHEVMASSSEFDTFREHIKDRSTKDYVDDLSKNTLKKIVSSIK